MNTSIPFSEQALRILLDSLLPGSALESVVPATGSFSNDTAYLDALSPSGARVRLVLRRYAVYGSYDRAEKARREFRALQMARAHGVPAPEPLYLDAEGQLLGSPGIVTGYVPGPSEWGAQLVLPADPERRARKMAATLARIHAVPCGDADRAHLLDANSEAVWFIRSETPTDERLVHPDGPEVWRAVRALFPHLRPVPPALVHLDYWSGNLLWRAGEIAAVLDWEEAAYGDPGVDVAYARMELYLLGGASLADAFLAAYEAETGRRVENLGLWELAASVRAMPDAAGWIPEWEALGARGLEVEPVRQRLRQFIAKARQQTGGQLCRQFSSCMS